MTSRFVGRTCALVSCWAIALGMLGGALGWVLAKGDVAAEPSGWGVIQVRGSVLRPGAEGPVEARLWFYLRWGGDASAPEEIAAAQTDARGHYEVEIPLPADVTPTRLAAADLLVTAHAPGFAPAVLDRVERGHVLADSKSVVHHVIDLESAGVLVQGVVRDPERGHGVPGVRVQLLRHHAGTEWVTSTITDARGTWRLGATAEGLHSICALGPEYGVMVDSVDVDPLRSSYDVGDLPIRDHRNAVIAVQYPDGKPITGVRVRAHYVSEHPLVSVFPKSWRHVTRRAGTSGDLNLFAYTDETRFDLEVLGAGDAGRAQRSGTGPLGPIVIDAGRIRLRITDEAAIPIPYVDAVAWGWPAEMRADASSFAKTGILGDDDPPPERRVLPADEEGRLDLLAEPGTVWVLVASLPDAPTARRLAVCPPRGVEKEIALDLIQPDPVPRGSIEIRVVNAEGAPHDPFRLQLVRPTGDVYSGWGRLVESQVHDLPADGWMVRVYPGPFLPSLPFPREDSYLLPVTVGAVVEAGQVARVTARVLPIGARLRIHVEDPRARYVRRLLVRYGEGDTFFTSFFGVADERGLRWTSSFVPTNEPLTVAPVLEAGAAEIRVELADGSEVAKTTDLKAGHTSNIHLVAPD